MRHSRIWRLVCNVRPHNLSKKKWRKLLRNSKKRWKKKTKVRRRRRRRRPKGSKLMINRKFCSRIWPMLGLKPCSLSKSKTSRRTWPSARENKWRKSVVESLQVNSSSNGYNLLPLHLQLLPIVMAVVMMLHRHSHRQTQTHLASNWWLLRQIVLVSMLPQARWVMISLLNKNWKSLSESET